MKKTALIIPLLVIAYLLWPTMISAQDKIPMVVAPARQQVNLDPGKSTSLITKFFNEGTSPLAGNIKVVDFIVTDNEGSPQFLFTQNLSNRFSGASWVKLSSDKVAISPGEIAKVQYTITAPKDAAPGGRYVALYFEPVGLMGQETASEAKNALSVVPRIASLLYIRVNGPISEMALIKKFLVPSFIQYGPVNVEVEIANKGDYHITPKGQVILRDMFGRVIDTKILEETNIFPDASRVINFSLGPRLLFGKFRVELSASYGESGMAIASTATFWAFPIAYFVVILLAVIILLLLGMFIWKRLKGRQSKLEEKLREEIGEIEQLKEKYKDTLTQSPQAGEKTIKKEIR